MNFLYSAVLAVALVLTLPYWLVQMLRRGKYRAGFAERIGRIPGRLRLDGRPVIWVHAVSVGEVLASSGIIRELASRYSNHHVVVSTTTSTGQQLARQRFGEENVFFFPLDFTFALRPYFDLLKPELIVVAETELWPNFFALAHARGARLAVINARVSDRSFPRYLFFRRWIQSTVANVDLYLAQSAEDAGRIVAMGAAPDRVEATGNVKFDTPPGSDSPLVQQLRPVLAQPVILGGSTVEGEEQIVLSAFRDILSRWPDAVLVVAPRHPERFDAVAGLLAGMRSWRRSQWNGEPVRGGVFLLDSIGELASLYQLADVAFVGGSLVPRGGHNILEAARYGVPVLAGPHNENFREIVSLFLRANAVQITDPSSLANDLSHLLENDTARHSFGIRARETWRANAGATARTLSQLERLLPRRQNVIVMPRKGSAG